MRIRTTDGTPTTASSRGESVPTNSLIRLCLRRGMRRECSARQVGTSARLFFYLAPRKVWICETTAAPSPMAPPTRLTEPARTSPIAKTPGTLVSSDSDPLCPVVTKPLSSSATSQSASQAVLGSAPGKRNTLRIGRLWRSPELRFVQVTVSTPDWREPLRQGDLRACQQLEVWR